MSSSSSEIRRFDIRAGFYMRISTVGILFYILLL